MNHRATSVEHAKAIQSTRVLPNSEDCRVYEGDFDILEVEKNKNWEDNEKEDDN